MRISTLLSFTLLFSTACNAPGPSLGRSSQAITNGDAGSGFIATLDAGSDDCFDESCVDQLYDNGDPLDSEPDDDSPLVDAGVPDATVSTALDGSGGGSGSGCTAQPEPACPSAPPGYQPKDPKIASGSLCRGACGPDCPTTCVAGPAASTCVEWQTADCQWHAKTCTYPTLSCGSHAGCRIHDACYDTCAKGIRGAACRRTCDIGCLRTYGLKKCRAWMKGNGPYDQWNDYAGAPTSQTYDTTCY